MNLYVPTVREAMMTVPIVVVVTCTYPLTRMRNLRIDKMPQPQLIPNTLKLSCAWPHCCRVVDVGVEITYPEIIDNSDNGIIICPVCGSISVVLGIYSYIYPLLCYCNWCGLVWEKESVVCLECGSFLVGNEDGNTLKCTNKICNKEWDIDLIKTEYSDPDFVPASRYVKEPPCYLEYSEE